jgi:hypothetical protein
LTSPLRKKSVARRNGDDGNAPAETLILALLEAI